MNLTLSGGPRDGRTIDVAPCAVVNVPEVLRVQAHPAAPLWVGDEFYAITHEYDGRTGVYLGVRKWPRVGPWSWFAATPFPDLSLFPRLDAWARKRKEACSRLRAAWSALRGGTCSAET